MSDPKMREDFEAWACSHEVYEDDGERLPMTRLSGCYYEHVQTQAAWEAWQASRDALAAQRDEGLAREAELRDELGVAKGEYDRSANKVAALQQRLAEAEKLLRDLRKYQNNAKGWQEKVDAFLSSPGCADGEKAS